MALPKPVDEAPPDPESQTELIDWAATRKRGPSRPSSIGDASWLKAREQADGMMRGGDWTGAIARHFAAAYELLHERVYGVAPAEMTPPYRSISAAMAARLLEKEFGGDPDKMADFMRWAWSREKGREEWRRKNNGGRGGRITPRTMFGGYLVTDYRVDVARRAKR